MTTSAKATAPRRPNHGNLRRNFRRFDPRRLDELQSRSADAFRQAAHSLKVAEAALGISDSTASAWQKTGEGSPVTDFLSLIDRFAHDPRACPGALVTAAKITLIECVMPLSDADLIARFWKLTNDEAAVEGRLNAAQQMFALTGDAAALADAARAVADNATELAAVAGEAGKRGLDVRPAGRA